jgi:DNA-binding LacI/PurR family transcriptional regulator
MASNSSNTRHPHSSSKITINDIAEVAGVSVSTVSRILNNRPDVAESTRRHVEKVIDELGYSPHSQARGLAAGRSRTIAMLYPFEQPSSYVELDFITGAGAAAGEEGYFFHVITRAITEVELLNLYRSSQVDGVILGQVSLYDWRIQLLQEHGLTFAMFGQCADNTGISFIDLDHYHAIGRAFGYLMELGHRRIGFLNYPRSVNETYGPAVRSQSAFERVCEQYGLEPFYKEVEFTVQNLAQATDEILDEHTDITAIFAADGARVAGVIRALWERGLRVPRDISVMGIGPANIAELVSPPLTTIDFPVFNMARQAARMLIDRLENSEAEIEQVLVKTDVIERKSTGPPGRT